MSEKIFTIKGIPSGRRAIVIDVDLSFSTEIEGERRTVSLKPRALIDTGAFSSCISTRLVKACRMESVSVVEMISAQGASLTSLYEVCITLPNEIRFEGIPVMEISGSKNFDVIIGMDILNRCDFAVTNENGETCFSLRYPATGHLDFPDS